MYLVNGNKKFGTLEFFQVMTLLYQILINVDSDAHDYNKIDQIFLQKLKWQVHHPRIHLQ